MTKSVFLFALLLSYPLVSFSTTAHDLRARIHIDGRLTDFEADEWVLDAETFFSELKEDSRWGRDNDIHGVAVTWDLHNVYIAIPCIVSGRTLMLFLDTDCGGPSSLEDLDFFRRNIRFARLSPNLILKTTAPFSYTTAGVIDCNHPLELLDSDRFETRLLQDGLDGGALEARIPWEVLGRFEKHGGMVKIPERGGILRLLAVVTGGPGTGAGDAAPDPSVVLENDSTRLAICDNAVVVPLDGNGDGFLDMGVSPRDIATFSSTEKSGRRQVSPLRLDLEEKVFSPDRGEVLRFLLSLDPVEDSSPVYLTARIHASSGELVNVIYEDLSRRFQTGSAPQWDEWDGRDLHGKIVPGGIYILSISGGPAIGSTTQVVKAALAVIR